MGVIPGGVVRNDLVWSTMSGAEIAVTGINTLYSQAWGDTATPDDVKTICQGSNSLIVAALSNAWTGLSQYISSHSHLTRVDSYALSSVTGKALSKATTGFSPVDHAGGSGSTPLPPTVAMTLSLWAFPVGGWQPDPKRWKGRLFIPTLATTALNSSTGMWSDTAMSDTETAWSTFLSQITGGVVGTGTADVVVLSRRDRAARKVVAVTASSVPSVQRRRVNALVHGHGTGAAVQ